jgi:hypothetical protein
MIPYGTTLLCLLNSDSLVFALIILEDRLATKLKPSISLPVYF